MDLRKLSNTQLLNETKRLVQVELKITTEVLHHLKEVERRRLFSELRYSSMIDYAVKELGYTHSSAVRRIEAARLLKKLPELEKKITDGTLSLSNINQAAGFFKKEQITNPLEQKEILKKLEHKTTREAEKTLLELSPEKPLPKESAKLVTPTYTQLTINVHEETLKKLNEARQLIGSFKINDEFIKKLAEHAIKDIIFKKFKTRETKQDPNSRYTTNQTKREVYEKSNGICENCGSIFMLQIDHIEEFSKGGKTETSNLRLLCFHCNQRRWFKTCNPNLS